MATKNQKKSKKNEVVTSDSHQNAFQLRSWEVQTFNLSELKSDALYQARIVPTSEAAGKLHAAEVAAHVSGIADTYRSDILWKAENPDKASPFIVPMPYVAWVDSVPFIVDGHTRKAAAELAGMQTLTCLASDCTKDEAMVLACAANATNGRARSNADKLNSVKRAHESEEFGKLSLRVAGYRLGVSHQMIDDYRKSQLPKPGGTGNGNGGTKDGGNKRKSAKLPVMPEGEDMRDMTVGAVKLHIINETAEKRADGYAFYTVFSPNATPPMAMEMRCELRPMTEKEIALYTPTAPAPAPEVLP